MQCLFYLGTHMSNWLDKTSVPLFLSRRVLYKRKTFPRAAGIWALDSGGFSELSLHGKWTVTPQIYVAEVHKFGQEIGNLQFAAPMDWMCEPVILEKTGLSLLEHQTKTIDNFLELNTLSPQTTWLPVLQGWEKKDYLSHVEQYLARGIDLLKYERVGIGSVCRRQHTAEAEQIIETLTNQGLRLHGFGFKILGLKKLKNTLHSSDSMAWSFSARYTKPLDGCTTHKNCANCLIYALQWREKMLHTLGD